MTITNNNFKCPKPHQIVALKKCKSTKYILLVHLCSSASKIKRKRRQYYWQNGQIPKSHCHNSKEHQEWVHAEMMLQTALLCSCEGIFELKSSL